MQYTAERRMEILEYICRKRRTSRFELALYFGVSTRTIERDLLILSCSYPIYTQQGFSGGVFVEDGYYLHKEYLKPSEQLLLEEIAKSLEGDKLKTMKSIIERFGRR